MVEKVFIRPVRTASGYRYDIEHEGATIVSRSKAPLYDAARALQQAGKDGKVEVWRVDGAWPCLTGDIERCARKTIRETERDGPMVVKWYPFVREAVDDAAAI